METGIGREIYIYLISFSLIEIHVISAKHFCIVYSIYSS
jgi:hypothetical protein